MFMEKVFQKSLLHSGKRSLEIIFEF